MWKEKKKERYKGTEKKMHTEGGKKEQGLNFSFKRRR